MTVAKPPTLPRRAAGVVGSAGGAIAAQFVLAGASLLLQAVAARSLGVEGFAHYVLVYGALVLVVALYTSWFGDALTVFDRFDARVRTALLWSLIGGVVSGSLSLAVFGSIFLRGIEVVAVAVVAATWIVNESTRRMFTARTEFWRLAVNDLFGAAVTAAVVGSAAIIGDGLTLASMFLAMAAGNLGSAVLACRRLPSAEFAYPGFRGGAVGDLARFSGWRSAQAGVRPSALLMSRIIIAATAGTAGVASVEAARLLLAPALTVANGSGSYFLSSYARIARSGRAPRSRDAVRATLVVAGSMSILGAVTVALSGPLARIVTGGQFDVDTRAVAGWALYTVVFAATLPMTGMAVTRKQSRFVFWLRAGEMSLGLGTLFALLVVDSALFWTAPYCLGVGGVVTALLLWAYLRRGDPSR